MAFGAPASDVALRIEPVYLLAVIATAAFMLVEEVGWRGYALSRLQAEHSALTSALIVGVGWGVWHIPLLFGRAEQFGLATDTAASITILVYITNTTMLSVVYTWLFNSTRGSLIVATLLHGSLNTASGTYSGHIYAHSLLFWVPMTLIVAGLGLVLVRRWGGTTLSKHEKVVQIVQEGRGAPAVG